MATSRLVRQEDGRGEEVLTEHVSMLTERLPLLTKNVHLDSDGDVFAYDNR